MRTTLGLAALAALSIGAVFVVAHVAGGFWAGPIGIGLVACAFLIDFQVNDQ